MHAVATSSATLHLHFSLQVTIASLLPVSDKMLAVALVQRIEIPCIYLPASWMLSTEIRNDVK